MPPPIVSRGKRFCNGGTGRLPPWAVAAPSPPGSRLHLAGDDRAAPLPGRLRGGGCGRPAMAGTRPSWTAPAFCEGIALGGRFSRAAGSAPSPARADSLGSARPVRKRTLGFLPPSLCRLRHGACSKGMHRGLCAQPPRERTLQTACARSPLGGGTAAGAEGEGDARFRFLKGLAEPSRSAGGGEGSEPAGRRDLTVRATPSQKAGAVRGGRESATVGQPQPPPGRPPGIGSPLITSRMEWPRGSDGVGSAHGGRRPG